jgi:Ca2+-binding EF-hand superfamily protein
VEKAFNMFDEDGNGFIDLNELKRMMGGIDLSDDEWKELILRYDKDNDGVVRESGYLVDFL